MRHYWVDRITALEAGRRAVGLKAIALAEDEFDAHFPGNPVFPGVYMVEGLAQTAGVLLYETSERTLIAVMSSIDRARFTGFARPGEVLQYTVEIESFTPAHAQVRGEARAAERTLAAARLSFRMVAPGRLLPEAFHAQWRLSMEVWQGRYPELDDG
jgi:3-hydroxyacyl-[acyl-carrier-protein] dehydratase